MGKIVCQNPDLWASYVPFGMESALHVLTRGLDMPDISFSFTFQDNPQFSPELDVISTRLTYHIATGTHPGTLGSGHINVYDQHQGKNIGRLLGRNLIEFYSLCGHHHEVYTTAGDVNGGYTWAKYGLLPSQLHDEGELYQTVNNRINTIWALLTDEEKTYISQFMHLNQPKDLWSIADANFDVSKRIIHSQDTSDWDFIKGSFLYCEQFGPKALKRLFEIAQSGRPISLGQFLLSGTTWGAFMDYKCPDQMQRVSAYTGGFRYISFE
jgi:hypothetical protein